MFEPVSALETKIHQEFHKRVRPAEAAQNCGLSEGRFPTYVNALYALYGTVRLIIESP